MCRIDRVGGAGGTLSQQKRGKVMPAMYAAAPALERCAWWYVATMPNSHSRTAG